MQRLFLPFLLAVVVAGCVDDAASEPINSRANEDEQIAPAPSAPVDGPAADTTVPEGDTIPWEIHECSFMYSNALADAAAVQADLPEGFTVQTGTGGRAGVGFETNICTSGTGVNGTITDQTYASIWIGVQPPAHLVVEPGAFHVMNFDVLVEDAERREWMQQRGVPAHDGGITITEVGPAQRIELDMDGTYVFTIGALQAVGNGGGTFDQWTPGGQGLTYWKTDWATTEQSTAVGTIEIDPASRYADWFETPIVPAQFTVGTWDYTDGIIVHPAPLA